jgi:3-methyladenine DNA glycosylase AlkD
MTDTEAIKKLKSLGTAQNRKVYARHGVTGKQFGVSFANLDRLKKEIKTDHDLAERLWATANHDARILATKIADPSVMTAKKLEAWARDLDNYVVTDGFASLAARSPLARQCMEKWTKARGEWVSSAGWALVAHLAMNEEKMPNTAFEARIKTIEKSIHRSKNRVRHAMNNGLIAMGIRNPKLENKAIAAAKRIGKVEVDHGETNCQTPDAVAYILKTLEYRSKKEARSS